MVAVRSGCYFWQLKNQLWQLSEVLSDEMASEGTRQDI